jgi:peptidoglycan/xylan/chitin deacetylase (PgdA/CDA1 family)
MAGYRKMVLRTIGGISSLMPLKPLVNLTSQKIIMPVLHTVCDSPAPHIKHLYKPKTINTFEKDLDFLLKHYEAIDFPTFKDAILSKHYSKKRQFILSFDDGLSEFNDIIAPILLKKGVPAICFLNSDFIDNKDIFYRYKASIIIESAIPNPSITRKSDIKDFKNRILSIDYNQRDLLDKFADDNGISFIEYLNKNQPYLSSEQIRSLIKKGFCFGSHSCNHPEYNTISFDEQTRQTIESTKIICNDFKLDHRAFAFPFTDYGVSTEFFDKIYAKPLGPEISFGCAGLKMDVSHRHFQRIPIETSNLSAKRIIKTEYLYYLIKSIFKKNKIKRR